MGKSHPANITVTVEVPRLLEKIVGSADDLNKRAKRALILDLVLEGELSQGKGAEILGVGVAEMMDLLAYASSRTGGLTADEILEDVRLLEAAFREQAARASD